MGEELKIVFPEKCLSPSCGCTANCIYEETQKSATKLQEVRHRFATTNVMLASGKFDDTEKETLESLLPDMEFLLVRHADILQGLKALRDEWAKELKRLNKSIRACNRRGYSMTADLHGIAKDMLATKLADLDALIKGVE